MVGRAWCKLYKQLSWFVDFTIPNSGVFVGVHMGVVRDVVRVLSLEIDQSLV